MPGTNVERMSFITSEVPINYTTANRVRGTNDCTDFSPNEERAINATSKPKFSAREQATAEIYVALTN